MPHERPNQVYELYLRVTRRIGHYRWFSLFIKHVGSQVDGALIHASRGRLSISGPAMPTMLLTTKGRKSGKERTVPATMCATARISWLFARTSASIQLRAGL
jgi:hypothetical protein